MPSPPPAAADILSRCRRGAARLLWRCPWQAERAHLEALDAYLLRDMGLSREQVRQGYDPASAGAANAHLPAGSSLSRIAVP